MIRILLSLAIAAAAYFGPWIVDKTGDITGPAMADIVLGDDVDIDRDQAGSLVADGEFFVGNTAQCWMDGRISISDECSPRGEVLGKLVAGTIIVGLISAVLSVVGLLPLVGRLTSIVTVLSGLLAIVAFGWFAKELVTTNGAMFTDFRWGGYATGVLGLLTVFAGMAGLRGDDG
jgi:hypothetical protein